MYVAWNKLMVDVAARVVKEVTCEHCKVVYFYALERSARGTGVSLYQTNDEGAAEYATHDAKEKLRSELDGAFELVPCPSCGDYQAQMVAHMKDNHLKWVIFPAGACVLAATGCLAAALIRESGVIGAIAVAFFVLGVGLIAFRHWSVNRFDPNQGDPEPRKKIGREVALLKQEIEGGDPASPTP